MAAEPVQVPGHLDYWIIRKAAPTSKGRHRWIWYDFRSKKAGVRKHRAGFNKRPLSLKPVPNKWASGRTDLQVCLWNGGR